MSESEPTLVEVLHSQVEAELALSKKLDDYTGRWVAVRDHDVIGAADSLEDLLAIIDPEDAEAFFEVQEHGAACFF